MKKKHMKRRFSRIIIVVLGISMFFAVSSLLKYVRTLLNDDVEINLTEIVTQNKDTITSKLILELNNISLIAAQITDRLNNEQVHDGEALKDVFLNYGLDESDVGTVLLPIKRGMHISKIEKLSMWQGEPILSSPWMVNKMSLTE